MSNQSVQLEGSVSVAGDRSIPIVVNLPSDPGTELAGDEPIVLILHGFKGFAAWGFFPYLADQLARRGMIALRMNFSHNGVEGTGDEFTRLDLFEKNTFGREIDEVGQVLEGVREGRVPGIPKGHRGSIGLLGHSRGGGIALLCGARYDQVDAVVTWSAVSTFERYSRRQLEGWKESGYLGQNSRTGQVMRLGSDLLRELENEGKNLDIVSAVRDSGKPLLILHGAVDLSVGVDNAERLMAVADRETTRMEVIPATGHTFGVGHPFSGSSPALEKAIEHSISFLSEHLL